MTTATGATLGAAEIYAACVAAFEEAGWRSSCLAVAGTIGTATVVDDRLIGGSLAVRGTAVRFLAFGAGPYEGRDAAFAELFARLNPVLVHGSFELHALLGPVCRASVDVAVFAADRAGVVRDLALGMAATATQAFADHSDLLTVVGEGADPGEAFAACYPSLAGAA